MCVTLEESFIKVLSLCSLHFLQSITSGLWHPSLLTRAMGYVTTFTENAALVVSVNANTVYEAFLCTHPLILSIKVMAKKTKFG